MNKKLKKQWVNALRSGKYKQGRGALKTKYGNYCCLGVLADIVDKKQWKEPVNCNSSWSYGYVSTRLPDSVLSKIGLSLAEEYVLMNKNDNAKCNFNKIAEYIEREL